MPLELTTLLDEPGTVWPFRPPEDLLARWRKRGPSRLWWVLYVRNLDPHCVIDMKVETSYGTARIPLLAATGPVPETCKVYEGPLALGFEWQLLEGVTGPVWCAYSVLGGRFGPPAPIVEKLELWEEGGGDSPRAP